MVIMVQPIKLYYCRRSSTDGTTYTKLENNLPNAYYNVSHDQTYPFQFQYMLFFGQIISINLLTFAGWVLIGSFYDWIWMDTFWWASV